MKAAKILSKLKPTDKLYKQKVKILAQLIEDPDGGHILPDNLYEWAVSVGIKTRDHFEDKCAWTTCNI